MRRTVNLDFGSKSREELGHFIARVIDHVDRGLIDAVLYRNLPFAPGKLSTIKWAIVGDMLAPIMAANDEEPYEHHLVCYSDEDAMMLRMLF